MSVRLKNLGLTYGCRYESCYVKLDREPWSRSKRQKKRWFGLRKESTMEVQRRRYIFSSKGLTCPRKLRSKRFNDSKTNFEGHVQDTNKCFAWPHDEELIDMHLKGNIEEECDHIKPLDWLFTSRVQRVWQQLQRLLMKTDCETCQLLIRAARTHISNQLSISGLDHLRSNCRKGQATGDLSELFWSANVGRRAWSAFYRGWPPELVNMTAPVDGSGSSVL